MLRSAIPTRFQKAWAVNAAGAYIRTVPVASQIGIQDGAASFNDGFVPDNFTSLDAGGVPPYGQDFNGVLNVTTSWDQWYQAGGPITYDATFSTAVSGYPSGAVVASAILLGAQWYSTVDGNTTDPDDPLTSVGWSRVGVPAGVALPFFTSTLPAGYVPMNALTIGSAASGAGYASADALFLFAANWSNFSNTQCPILTSAGAASTRGANAVADFVANKRLTLPNGKGLSFIGADTMGGAASTFLSGVPVTSGNTTTPGSILGANLQGLITGNLPVIVPSGSVSNGGISVSVGTSVSISQNANSANATSSTGGGGFSIPGTAGASISASAVSTASASQGASSFSGNSIGSNTAHNNVEFSMVVFWGQKL